jgi:hypothetical protein
MRAEAVGRPIADAAMGGCIFFSYALQFFCLGEQMWSKEFLNFFAYEKTF